MGTQMESAARKAKAVMSPKKKIGIATQNVNHGNIDLPVAGLDKFAGHKKGGIMESKKMVKKEVAFMQKKGAPKSMIRHEKAEAGYARGGRIRKFSEGGDPFAADWGTSKGVDEVSTPIEGGNPSRFDKGTYERASKWMESQKGETSSKPAKKAPKPAAKSSEKAPPVQGFGDDAPRPRAETGRLTKAIGDQASKYFRVAPADELSSKMKAAYREAAVPTRGYAKGGGIRSEKAIQDDQDNIGAMNGFRKGGGIRGNTGYQGRGIMENRNTSGNDRAGENPKVQKRGLTEGRVIKMASGGAVKFARGGGIEQRGKTRGKMC